MDEKFQDANFKLHFLENVAGYTFNYQLHIHALPM